MDSTAQLDPRVHDHEAEPIRLSVPLQVLLLRRSGPPPPEPPPYAFSQARLDELERILDATLERRKRERQELERRMLVP